MLDMKQISKCSRRQTGWNAIRCDATMLASLISLLSLAVGISRVSYFATGFQAPNGNFQSHCQRFFHVCQAKKGSKSDDILWVEKGLTKDRGFFPILGSDESGRGCVAGPVVAATCAIMCDDWNDYTPITGVRDSKELSPEERLRIYNLVVASPDLYIWSVAERSREVIDEMNILMATMECFKDSIEQVVAELPEDHNAYSIVDGKKGPKLSPNIQVPCRPWVQGDKEVYSVALASILAKVSRDHMSAEWHRLYPEYGFDVHHGYATRHHIEAIHRYGPCPIHRLSFKTLNGR